MGSSVTPPLPPRSAARRLGRSLLTVVRTLRTNPLSFAGFVLVILLVVTALVVTVDPSVLPYAPLKIFEGTPYQGPSASHFFGTDELGRDVFSNVVAALPIDLSIGFLVAGTSLLFGGTLGVIAGYYNRPRSLGAVASTVILRLTDLFLAFPSLVLALAFTVTLGRGLFQVVLAVFLTWWPFYVRLTRGEVLTVKNQLYVSAARAAGVTERRIVLRHVLRNILEPLVVYFTLDVGTVIVTFSTVAFVTSALPYPTGGPPEWGAMITFYRTYVTTAPWTIAFPGIAIFVTVLAFSLLGDGLRDLLDPRSRRVITQAPRPTGGVGGVAEPARNAAPDSEDAAEAAA